MKLYLWRGVLSDYTSGVIFALANSLNEAKHAVCMSAPDWSRMTLMNEMDADPEIIEDTFGFALWGGG